MISWITTYWIISVHHQGKLCSVIIAQVNNFWKAFNCFSHLMNCCRASPGFLRLLQLAPLWWLKKTKNISGHKNWNIWKAFLLISTILWYFNWGFSLNIAIWKTKITSETEKYNFFPLLCSLRLWNNLLVFSVLILTHRKLFSQFSIFKRLIALKRFIWNNYNCPFSKKFSGVNFHTTCLSTAS